MNFMENNFTEHHLGRAAQVSGPQFDSRVPLLPARMGFCFSCKSYAQHTELSVSAPHRCSAREQHFQAICQKDGPKSYVL